MGETLTDGSRVGIIGGGPAGSMTAFFLLTIARRLGIDVNVDIYEPRDFTRPGPTGCNMCGGIVSESLIQMLAAEGIILPTHVVQRGIDSYVLHTDESDVRIDTPTHEKRIAAVHRGGGPRDVSQVKWGGLDGYLQGLAKELGANMVPARVTQVAWSDGRPEVRAPGTTARYDLVVGAVGVNMAGWKVFDHLGFKEPQPTTARAYITELKVGAEVVTAKLGSSMHIYLLDIPHLDFAAIIPKGDYATVCLLGSDIDRALVEGFFAHPAVRSSFGVDINVAEGACHCSPRINVREVKQPFLDRVVLVGDCGVTRLYKDGIGAAYRTSKAAALTALLHGLTEADFRSKFLPAYRAVADDNRYGRMIFSAVHRAQRSRLLMRGVVRMASREQATDSGRRPMSMVLWDMFTGSAAYRDIFRRSFDPRFFGRFFFEAASRSQVPTREAATT